MVRLNPSALSLTYLSRQLYYAGVGSSTSLNAPSAFSATNAEARKALNPFAELLHSYKQQGFSIAKFSDLSKIATPPSALTVTNLYEMKTSALSKFNIKI